MTRKLSISLSDDLAAHLDGVENASAVIAAALRKHIMATNVRQALIRQGFDITDNGIEEARREYDAALETITDETRIVAARMYADILERRRRFS
jgi:predicted transcriptional regulator